MIIPIVVLVAPSDSPSKGMMTPSIEFALKYKSVNIYNLRKGQDSAPFKMFAPFSNFLDSFTSEDR
ncbi:hypothetical protein D3C73_1483830 [compost metagenome]